MNDALGSLRSVPQWFLYRLEWDAAAGKHKKTPCALNGAPSPINAGDPRNWNTYDAARAALAKLTPGQYTLGFWFTADSGFFFVDVDKCIFNGIPTPIAHEISTAFKGAYAEVSVSGTGYHFIGRSATIPPHRSRGEHGLELYSHGRGCAFGNIAGAVGNADTRHDAALGQVIAKYFPPHETAVGNGVRRTEWSGPADDAELVRRMLAAKTSAAAAFGGKVPIAKLWAGDCERNSENDMALASHLAFWTGADAERMTRLMWQSGMVREKWREHRTYLQSTIANACAACTTVYQERKAPPSLPLTPQPVRIQNAAVLMQKQFAPVQWAIRDILPEGVTILGGDPKIGKSWLVLNWCVAVSCGLPIWAGREPEAAGDVLYLALEDSDRRMQRRLSKLLPAFGNPSLQRMEYATGWERGVEGAARIREWLESHPQASMVVIDTLAVFREGDPGRKSAYQYDYDSIRPLTELANEYPVAIVLVHHNRKGDTGDTFFNQKISGTQGLTGSAGNNFVLERGRGNNVTAILRTTGRDIEQEAELALQLIDGKWSSLGNIDEVTRSEQRSSVLEALTRLGGCGTAKQVHEELGGALKLPAVKMRLTRMHKGGEIDKAGAIYTLLQFPPPEKLPGLPSI